MDNWRRVFYLPQALAEKRPVAAEFINGKLNITMG
ncbi:hypothetical protein [Thermogymnomonas acidicola]|nr:hypothetical protein [Thermogymnomonas acidicola]